MTGSTTPSAVTQADIDVLLESLQSLLEQIRTERKALAPLKASFELAYTEFQVAVGHLLRQAIQLQTETESLRLQIEDATRNHIEDWQEDRLEDTDQLGVRDPDAVAKDMLLEHLMRVLDELNEDDMTLLASVQGLCLDPQTSLANVLDVLPWGSVWTTRGTRETLHLQQRRLKTWQQALNEQLEALVQRREKLHRDPRYGIWQQRQRGLEEWRSFLTQAVEQQEAHNESLRVELEKVRAEWEQIRKTL